MSLGTGLSLGAGARGWSEPGVAMAVSGVAWMQRAAFYRGAAPVCATVFRGTAHTAVRRCKASVRAYA